MNITLGTNVAFQLISLERANFFISLNFLVFGPLISIFGMLANVINIAVYHRQGTKDSVAVSLLSLSASDLCGLVSALWYCVGSNPLFLQMVDYVYIPREFLTLTAALPRAFFSRLTCWITVYITVERCMCVVAPLKVKGMLTPRRATLVILSLLVIGFLVTFPRVYLHSTFLAWKYDPVQNKSVLGLGYGPNYLQVDEIGGSFNTPCLLIPFGILILSTIVVIAELQRISVWRLSVANSGGKSAAKFVKRDKVVFKVTGSLAVALIVCYLPQTAIFITLPIFPEFNISGRYSVLYLLVWNVAWTLESINSSSTIFIYYFVSSRYRATFKEMFHLK